MASTVDICNLALAHLGDDANIASINPPEATPQAAHCARFYPIALNELLEQHSWSFATKRANLALLAETPPPTWLYVYALPSDHLNAARVLDPTDYAAQDILPPTWLDDCNENRPLISPDNDAKPFVIETLASGAQVIYTNVQNAILVYTAKVTDTTKFSALFTTALSYKLASYVGGPLTKDPKLVMSMIQMAATYQAKAEASDANSRRSDPYRGFVPSAIAARR